MSPRIRALRTGLIEIIPRIPNDRVSLLYLQQRPLTDLLVAYVNWRSRYVSARRRIVVVEQAAVRDCRWQSNSDTIEKFLNVVRSGGDLAPYLSLKPHTRGIAPAAWALDATIEERWSDKDFLLNTMGFHHFHMGPGRNHRTKDLIFAHVTRDQFNVIAIFDHSVFHHNSSERERMFSVHEEWAFRETPLPPFSLRSGLASSGHTDRVILYAQHCYRVIRDLDPRLDDLSFVANLFDEVPTNSSEAKAEWGFAHLDLGLIQRRRKIFTPVTEGWT